MSGLMKGGADMFVENMPGLPDNIRLSSSGGYWVAMAAVRPNPGFSWLDFLSEKTWIKRMIFKVKKILKRTFFENITFSRGMEVVNICLSCFFLFTGRFKKTLGAVVKTVVSFPW